MQCVGILDGHGDGVVAVNLVPGHDLRASDERYSHMYDVGKFRPYSHFMLFNFFLFCVRGSEHSRNRILQVFEKSRENGTGNSFFAVHEIALIDWYRAQSK